MSDRSCPTRKARHATEADVQAWLASYRRTKHHRAPRMRAYRCEQCGGWHVSKWQSWKPERKRRKKGVAW